MAEHRKLLLPCNCVGSCTILAVDDWGEEADDPNGWMIEFYLRYRRGSLAWRLKTAVKVALGRDHYIEAVCLDGHDIRKLVDFVLDSPAFPTGLPVRAAGEGDTAND